MSAQLALVVEQLHAGYDSNDVLRDVSLRVGQTERVGLFGPNGHGKTTLLNAISAIIKPHSGSIQFMGEEISGLGANAIVSRGLVYVPQANILFPTMEIEETLELAAYVQRARAERKARMEQVYEMFPRLKERRRQLCRTLSGGERQMLAIGVGLMSNPRMLMLDEPTLGLSPKLKDELATVIDQISRTGIPLLLVEQDISFVLSLVDRMYMVDHGEIAREISKGSSVDHDDIMRMYFGEEKFT
jgi:branched-chain amino acid transport system ATP-binding protein